MVFWVFVPCLLLVSCGDRTVNQDNVTLTGKVTRIPPSDDPIISDDPFGQDIGSPLDEVAVQDVVVMVVESPTLGDFTGPNGNYSIPNVPLGIEWTISAKEDNVPSAIPTTCEVKATDVVSLEITSSTPSGACGSGSTSLPGTLILDIRIQ